MGILESIPASTIAAIVSILGMPGLIFIIWYVDLRRTEKILAEYKADMARLARFYENNVELATNYQKLASELAGIIHLNTQAQTNLVNAIRNNSFCPMARKEIGQ